MGWGDWLVVVAVAEGKMEKFLKAGKAEGVADDGDW